ncbi:hypothetical protein [Methylomarinum vadi]|uniref:hypothetical protein n=1 Tax=Methylomarinum vadi TaxID=438855 RepID=UPI0004DF7AA4|nr:hypothetical protein [Methylomarinum vadi]
MATQTTIHTTTELNFKNGKEVPVHRLPFVDTQPGKSGISFWNVPKTGGYSGGCKTGNALALIYLKHLREYGCGDGGGSLQTIAMDMFDSEGNDSPEHDALRGQMVGFFSELDRYLAGAVNCLTGDLDKYSNEKLLQEAIDGLNSCIEGDR